MDKEVVVCCDIDDTLWDLLFYWVKYNNYLHNCGDVRYQLLDEDLNNYTTWSMSDKFIIIKNIKIIFLIYYLV